MQVLDAELEKDLEQWFRASLVLLVATRNMEMVLFGWLYSENVTPMGDFSPMGVFLMGLRLLLAISVIEMMPDQELFSIIHPGPPKIKYDKTKSFWSHVKEYSWPMTKGIVCQHLNRSSPVFAILCAIAHGWVGWFCYGMALAQYLIIGLVTSKDKALDALSEFDRQVAERRRALIEEFEYVEKEIEEQNLENADVLRANAPKPAIPDGSFSSAVAEEKPE
jgi:sensor histidine kinase YesM